MVRSSRLVSLSKGLAVLSVERFPLVRAYRAGLWAEVVPELDRAAAAVAGQQHGSVDERRTIDLAGVQARRYELSYVMQGKQLIERIVFVLRGKTEYLLLCRYERGGTTAPCDGLLSSFKLAAA